MIEGLDKLKVKLNSLSDTQEVENRMMKACLTVEKSAKIKSHRSDTTGDLSRSIESRVDTKGDRVIGTIYSPLFYAPYVEYGTGLFAEKGDGRKDVPWSYCDEKGKWHSTSGQHPKPFLRTALQENSNNILNILGGVDK